MASIYHHVANYTAPHDNKHTVQETAIECSRADLARCLITVGNPSFFTWATIRQFGFTRAFYDSVISKFGLVMQNLRVENRQICRHPIFDSYVSDQKRLVSYNLGMAFAKFYAEAIFGIPNLIHIEFLKKQNAVVLNAGANQHRGREPDLVGSDAHGMWHLFEAKGSSGGEGVLSGKIADAKDQLNQVAMIHGAQPETRSACATSIGLEKIVSRIEDPEGDSEKFIEIPREEYFDAYYKPFLPSELPSATDHGLTLRDHRVDGVEFVGFELEKGSTKFLIGLESEMRSQIQSRDFQFSPSIRQKLGSLSRRASERYSVGLDGYVVQNLG